MGEGLATLASAIGVPAMVAGLFLWWLERRDRAWRLRQGDRRRETVLVLEGLLTIGGLAGATAQALKDGHANGGVSEALEQYAGYREELKAFLVEQTAATPRR